MLEPFIDKNSLLDGKKSGRQVRPQSATTGKMTFGTGLVFGKKKASALLNNYNNINHDRTLLASNQQTFSMAGPPTSVKLQSNLLQTKSSKSRPVTQSSTTNNNDFLSPNKTGRFLRKRSTVTSGDVQ